MAIGIFGSLFVFLVFLAILGGIALIVVRAISGGKKRSRSAVEVAAYIRNQLNDEGGPQNWDDFINVAIADPALEAIRREAERIQMPPEKSDEKRLEALLKRAEALIR